jgi:hypothetical protein
MKTFEQWLAFGEEGERFIAERLISAGKAVSNNYQFQTKATAPAVFWKESGQRKRLVLPDLQVWTEDRQVFVEVKRKTQWGKWCGALETGTEAHLFQHYEAVQRKTGHEVFLFFLHQDMAPTGVYCASIAKCRDALNRNDGARIWDGLNIKTGSKVVPHPMAMFAQKILTRICDFDPSQLEAA